MGFVGEPPSQPLPPSPMANNNTLEHHVTNMAIAAVHHHQQHQTSLDLLHSSPFSQPPHGSMFSNTSNANNDCSMGGGGLFANMSELQASSGLDPRYHQDDYEDDDMPFAVDTGSSNMNEASALVASFCNTQTKRLALFESQQQQQQQHHHNQMEDDEDDIMNSLADQLAEFKSFGASLALGGSESEASASTPISLRT
jgi:hypothetical protein